MRVNELMIPIWVKNFRQHVGSCLGTLVVKLYKQHKLPLGMAGPVLGALVDKGTPQRMPFTLADMKMASPNPTSWARHL